MRKQLLIGVLASVIFTFAQNESRAQKSMIRYSEPEGWSLGVTMGMSDLWGDVGTNSIIDHYANDKYLSNIKGMGGVFARYAMHPGFIVRLGVNHGTLYANDNFNYTKAKSAKSYEDDAVQRYVRNLNVKSIIWEGNFLFEINPFRFNIESRSALRNMQPYLLVGVAGFHYKPKGEHFSRTSPSRGWVNLHELHTEGQGFDFTDAPEQDELWQLAVPAGLGVKWDLGKQCGISVEWLYRVTFTDYLDNVSGKYIPKEYFDANLAPQEAQTASDMSDKSWMIQGEEFQHAKGEWRGNPNNNDSYSTLSVNFFWKIKSKRRPWWY